MLVLSRKRLEEVVVGEGEDAVRISVVDIRGDTVRLGITARREMPIHRAEVAARIEAERQRDGGS